VARPSLWRQRQLRAGGAAEEGALQDEEEDEELMKAVASAAATAAAPTAGRKFKSQSKLQVMVWRAFAL
jgi:hypothetical protein